MRFPQLNIGDRFEYRGEIWTKNGPLTAVRVSDNHSAMIPRYAAVTRVDEGDEQAQAENAAPAAESIDMAELERLLDIMATRMMDLLDGTAELSEDTREALRAKLISIRNDVRGMAGKFR